MRTLLLRANKVAGRSGSQSYLSLILFTGCPMWQWRIVPHHTGTYPLYPPSPNPGPLSTGTSTPDPETCSNFFNFGPHCTGNLPKKSSTCSCLIRFTSGLLTSSWNAFLQYYILRLAYQTHREAKEIYISSLSHSQIRDKTYEYNIWISIDRSIHNGMSKISHFFALSSTRKRI